MARIDNLTNFLTDVANAIKIKKGNTDPIQASNFDIEIENLPSGSGTCDFEINNCAYLFYNGARIENSDLFISKCQNVISTSSMFSGCTELTSIDLTNFSSLPNTSMQNMFYNCQSLTNVILTNFNTTNVKSMANLFKSCSSLETVDVSSFNTSKVTNISSLFDGCNALSSINLSSFDTSLVTNMSGMFNQCRGLQSLDLSSFNTNRVTNISTMFNYCNNLTHLDIRNFDFTKVTTHSNAFTNMLSTCEIIVKSDTEKSWITSKFAYLTNVKTVAEYEAEL